MSFSLDIKKLAELRKGEMGAMKRAIVFKVFESGIKMSPVETGRFKGNWFVTENTPSTQVNTRKDKSMLGNIGNSSKKELDLIGENFTVDILTNNLPYARKLEYGGYNHATDRTTASGYSSQAPFGMLRVTLRRFAALAKKEGWK